MKSVSDERNRNNDRDILFCLILVDKFKQMNGEQKEVMQIEVLQAIELCRQLLMPLQPTNPFSRCSRLTICSRCSHLPVCSRCSKDHRCNLSSWTASTMFNMQRHWVTDSLQWKLALGILEYFYICVALKSYINLLYITYYTAFYIYL